MNNDDERLVSLDHRRRKAGQWNQPTPLMTLPCTHGAHLPYTDVQNKLNVKSRTVVGMTCVRVMKEGSHKLVQMS